MLSGMLSAGRLTLSFVLFALNNSTHVSDCLITYKSQSCRLCLLIQPPLISEEDALQVDLSEHENFRALYKQGKRRHNAELPCFRLQGPLIHVLIDPANASAHHPLGGGTTTIDLAIQQLLVNCLLMVIDQRSLLPTP